MRYTLILAALLSGCAARTAVWSHDTATPEQTQTALRQCHFEAVRATVGISNASALVEAYERYRAREEVGTACMEAKGFRLSWVTGPAPTTQNAQGGKPQAQ